MLHRSGFGNSISTRVSFILVKSVIESDIRTHVQTIETCSITVLHGRDPWALFRKTFVVVIYRPVIYKPIFDHKFMHKKRRCRNFWLIWSYFRDRKYYETSPWSADIGCASTLLTKDIHILHILIIFYLQLNECRFE